MTELLTKYNYEVEFEIQFQKDPYYNFNSFKTHKEKGKNEDSYHYPSYDYDSYSDEEKYTLRECLNEMKKSEKLIEGNEVFCSVCKDLKLAEKKM